MKFMDSSLDKQLDLMIVSFMNQDTHYNYKMQKYVEMAGYTTDNSVIQATG